MNWLLDLESAPPVPVDEGKDVHETYCRRCNTASISGVICDECRLDAWEWAESYGGGKDEISNRAYGRMQSWRYGGKNATADS